MGNTIHKLKQKTIGSPFVPLLFISEAIKNVSFYTFAQEPPIDVVLASVVMAVVTTGTWLYADEEIPWFS